MSGCTHKLRIKDEPPIKELAVCIRYGPKIDEIFKNDIDSITNIFIDDYNSKNGKYHLIECQYDNERTLYLDVKKMGISDPKEQAAGILITTLGIILPINMIANKSPIIVGFIFLPYSGIKLNTRLSMDISKNGNPRKRVSSRRKTKVTSGKYFGSYEKQRQLLYDNYYNHLFEEIEKIEKNYKR